MKRCVCKREDAMRALKEMTDTEVSNKASGGGAYLCDIDADICRRGLLAFLRSSRTTKKVEEVWVDAPKAIMIEYDGKCYLSLLYEDQVAAVFRIRIDLQLKRLRRAPEPVMCAAENFRRHFVKDGGFDY